MKYPKFLSDNGTIAFVAPSFGCATEPYTSRMNNAIKFFASLGFKTDLGPNTFASSGVGISNTPEKCAEELEEYYSSHGDVLMSVGGGELMCETLGKLSLEKFEKFSPKWFLGYSDNTNFGFLLPTMFDTASLYGPNAPSFGTEPQHRSLKDCLELIRGKSNISHGYDMWEIESDENDTNPLKSYNLTEKTELKFRFWNGKEIEGRFVGGCLDVLDNLCGTRFDNVKAFNEKYKNDGIIWFLEACDLGAMDIRRSLWKLKNAGWFDSAKAFVFGRPLHISDAPDFCGIDVYGAVASMLDEFNLPVILDADIGHLPPSMTMINGGYGVLGKYGENNIRIKWIF